MIREAETERLGQNNGVMGRRKLPRGTDVESEASGHGGLSDGGDWSAGAWGIPWKREEERGAGRAGGQRRAYGVQGRGGGRGCGRARLGPETADVGGGGCRDGAGTKTGDLQSRMGAGARRHVEKD